MKRLSALLAAACTLSIAALASADTLTLTTDKACYTRGQQIRFTAVYKNSSGNAITSPSTREIRLRTAPGGTTLVQTSMTNAGSGNYTYNYTLSSSAVYGTYETRLDFIYNGNETKIYFNKPVVASSCTTTPDTTPPATTASPASSTTLPVTVTLTASESGSSIYYTTNGTTPTTASAKYTSALTFSTVTTLKYFAVDAAGNAEAVKTATYGSAPVNSHSTLTYTGGTMCLSCHASQATAMSGAVHYKWEGAYSEITNKPGVTGGKLNSAMNTFCINTLGNWNGCGSCHVGAGAKPGTVADATQNIDCLICHQTGYKRVRNATTNLFEPDLTKMTITMDQAVQTVTKPVKSNCLQCHAKGGGGDGLKRGDLSVINGTTTDRNFDVHMATTGAKLVCQSCHTYTNHKVKGRGVDLRPTDVAGEIGCATTTCHSNKATLTSGHATTAVNTHLKRVACQTCHIPVAGKKAADAVLDTVTGFGDQATEYDRTWVTPEWSVANNRWEPTVHKANNIKPAYLFWDGTSWASDLNDAPVVDAATGKIKISRPNGGINTANTKIFPFKYKTSLQPRHIASGKLIALNTSVYFKTADVAGAITSGLTNMGLNAADAYDFVSTDEYLLLTHTVSPKAAALACAACHGPNSTTPGTQMNLKAMGYTLKGTLAVVCTQCHGSESNPGFTSVHSKHVTSKGYDCSFCHNFSRATERNLKLTK
jgi:Cytochrome c bacterial/Chitobiase/beta-hexosaminidase C-terminal domain